jgi:Flp pilus assembly protein TadD
MENRLNERAF